jgi:hypothetical protein
MLVRSRRLLVVAGVVGVVPLAWLVLALNCPSAGIGITRRAWQQHRLKNRTQLPEAADFDPRVTLDALLQRGNDRSRWSTDRAARVQGLVVDVAYSGAESANCWNPCRRDIHILIANRKEAPQTEQVVLEVTPRMRDWAAAQGIDWSEEALQSQLVGHWCEFEGWLYFDVGHDEESENVAPGNSENWRATAWEIHPITRIRIVK